MPSKADCRDEAHWVATQRNRRKSWLRVMYNLSVDEYDTLAASQDHRCAICHEECRSGKRLCVDHDHNCCAGEKSCGKCIRGLLCRSCNYAIGKLGDDLDRVRSAADYLEAWAADRYSRDDPA